MDSKLTSPLVFASMSTNVGQVWTQRQSHSAYILVKFSLLHQKVIDQPNSACLLVDSTVYSKSKGNLCEWSYLGNQGGSALTYVPTVVVSTSLVTSVASAPRVTNQQRTDTHASTRTSVQGDYSVRHRVREIWGHYLGQVQPLQLIWLYRRCSWLLSRIVEFWSQNAWVF